MKTANSRGEPVGDSRRRVRVLHVGNIANNAYLNAKLLNAAGFDCDVLCYDYFHVMGCPEWEEAALTETPADQNRPDWTTSGYERPRWFAQGRLLSAIEYLVARRSGGASPEPAWRRLQLENRTRKWSLLERARVVDQARRNIRALRRRFIDRETLIGQAVDYGFWRSKSISKTSGEAGLHRRLGALLGQSLLSLGKLARPVLHELIEFEVSARSILKSIAARLPWSRQPEFGVVESQLTQLVSRFAEAFPTVPAETHRQDLARYDSLAACWKRLVAHYDVVVGYATDGIWPLIAGNRPYIAFEHGTIRNIPFEPTTQGRLCAMTYRMADVSFVTNCDNQSAAERLELSDYRFVPHPVNETDVPRERADEFRRGLAESHGADFVAFHPSRQHWEEGVRHPDWEKGNDRFLRGFAKFVHEVAPNAVCVCVEWGATLEESKALIAELGIADRVVWIPCQPNQRMVSWIQASDVLADQFHLGAFGSTTPKALLHGCPTMLHLDEEQHRWAFPEMPPVVNVREPREVFEGLRRLYEEPNHREDLSRRGREWYDAHHSNRVIAERFARAFEDILERTDDASVGPGAAA